MILFHGDSRRLPGSCFPTDPETASFMELADVVKDSLKRNNVLMMDSAELRVALRTGTLSFNSPSLCLSREEPVIVATLVPATVRAR